MRRILRFTPLLGLMAISACETMQGAGRDLSTAGQVITEQSKESQTQMGLASTAVTPAPY